MLGLAGAAACLAGGTLLGLWASECCARRLRQLESWRDALAAMRLLLEEERLPMGELIAQSARAAGKGVRERLERTARQLAQSPRLTVAEAYEAAAREEPLSEQSEEKEALRQLFSQLGSGTTAMRAQAAEACQRRLEPLIEAARAKAQLARALYVKLGLLCGLMAGIALW